MPQQRSQRPLPRCHKPRCRATLLTAKSWLGCCPGKQSGAVQGKNWASCRAWISFAGVGETPPPKLAGQPTTLSFLGLILQLPTTCHIWTAAPPPRGTNARHRSPVAPLPKPPATKGTPGGGTLPQGRVGGGQLACLRAPPGGGLAFPPQPPTDRLRCVAPHWPLISLVGFDGASQARQSHARR